MSSDNKQTTQEDPAQTLNSMLTQGGITPQQVASSEQSVANVQERITNTVTANNTQQQVSSTDQTNVQGTVINRTDLLEQFRGRESDLVNNYREIPNINIQPTIGDGVRITAIIPAEYVRTNPVTNRPELTGSGVQTVDNNGNLTRGFNLRSTTLSPNANGTYTMQQDYAPKGGRSTFSRSSVGVRYDSNPTPQYQGSHVGLRLTIQLGAGSRRPTLEPYAGSNNVTVNGSIPLYQDPNRPQVSPSSVRATVLLNVENTQNQSTTNRNANTQPLQNGKQGTTPQQTVKVKGPNL